MQTKYANPSLKTTAPPTFPVIAFKPDGLLHINHFLTLFKSSLAEAFCKKGALKNSQISKGNTCARVSFKKVAGLRSCGVGA